MPLLIIVLTVSIILTAQYVSISKQFVEKGIPERDEWTEPSALNPDGMWESNGVLEADYSDKYVGNSSIKASVNADTLWMRINFTETVNCTEYPELFFRVKWLQQNVTFPSQGATLKIFSENSGYFRFDLSQRISSNSGAWANITLGVGRESTGWVGIDSPFWDRVTALELELRWPESANSTMKIDDVYFGGNYIPYLSVYEAANWLSVFATTLMSYVLRWAIIFSVILVTFKILRVEQKPGRLLFTSLGYAFIVEAVYQVVLFGLLFALPAVNFPLRLWVPVADSDALRTELAINAYQGWYNHIVWQISPYVLILFQIWFAIAVGGVLRAMYNFSWSRSIVIATFSAFIGLLLATIIISLYALA